MDATSYNQSKKVNSFISRDFKYKVREIMLLMYTSLNTTTYVICNPVLVRLFDKDYIQRNKRNGQKHK